MKNFSKKDIWDIKEALQESLTWESETEIGFEEDERIHKGINWLLEMRQDDGGWIIPMMMYKMNEYHSLCNKPAIPPKKELPFSHMVTGMVVRAFAAHPSLRSSQAAIQAGRLLKHRMFKKDVYTSRASVDYWFKFQFPFWWTDPSQ